jgi:4-alpha-glucanotransferase
MPPASAPPLQWLSDRSAGVLLHPTSLPGNQGIGVLGGSAYAFIGFLKEAGFRYWQMLPLGVTGYGDSPYQAFSAFAGNPYLIDLQPLLDNGILKFEELGPLRELPQEHVDYGALYRIKWALLRLAHKRFLEQKRAYLPNYGFFEEFKSHHKGWLEPYCAFMALKEHFGGSFWGEWPEAVKSLDGARKDPSWDSTADAREAHAFYQYLFYGQWALLRAAANEAGIELIGDAPIFVALDSADVWASPQWFEMDKPGEPTAVAGVPPDYFSETGQLWGNPLYDWEALAADKFKWWIERLKANFELFDVVRLDHFRGFWNYWRVPAKAKDARSGKWMEGPQDAFFKTVARRIPKARIIAEDLGDIDQDVRDFRDRLGLPGMSILQFAFDGNPENLYLPHNHLSNSVVYPGTHDNNTSRGWYEEAPEAFKDQLRRYLRVSGDELAWDFIRSAYASVSGLAIIPMQDLLSLDASSRMNTPGFEQGNWQWRFLEQDLHALEGSLPYLRELAWLYQRLPQSED